jgi:hypothetical protein
VRWDPVGPRCRTPRSPKTRGLVFGLRVVFGLRCASPKAVAGKTRGLCYLYVPAGGQMPDPSQSDLVNN